MEQIPEDIEKWLAEDEIIEKSFKLRDRTVYASGKRLLMKKGDVIRDFDYGHISNIEFKKERGLGPLYSGIFLIIGVGFLSRIGVLDVQLSAPIGVFFLLLGLFLIITVFTRGEIVELTVAGLALPLKLKGEKSELDSLFEFIKEKRI